MKTTKTPIALALTAAWLGLASAPAARAALVLSTPGVAFGYSTSLSDSEGGAATTQNNVALGSTALAQFNAAQGVLTGATLTLDSTRTQTTTTTATSGRDKGNDHSRSTSGSGSSTAALSVAGASASFGSISQADTCSGTRLQACGDGASSSATPTNAAVGLAAMNALVGGGSVNVQASLPKVSALQGAPQFSGTESTAYQLQWVGTMALSYQYLLHAAGSFDGSGLQSVLNLDFGNVALGSSAVLGFSLFNLIDPHRVGLDLDGISGSGDIDKLSTDLAAFAALGAGGSAAFRALLDTSSAGDFAASYVLDLSDADVGAAASRLAHSLTLNLNGRVLDAAARNNVPEPASLALVAAGLAGIGMARRRRGA